MNINRFLCKRFDTEKKGYVTPRDFWMVYFFLMMMFSFVGVICKISEIKIAKCELKKHEE